jgi:type VI protein secretion system component Hcp
MNRNHEFNPKSMSSYDPTNAADVELTDEELSQAAGGADRPTESLSLNFTKIEHKYNSQ